MSDIPGEGKEDFERVRRAAEALSEHFDSVQIFCTRHDTGGEGGTINVKFGVGNYYARLGHIREWLIKEDEATREEIRDREKDE